MKNIQTSSSSVVYIARYALYKDELSSVDYAEACFSSRRLAREWLRQFEDKEDVEYGFRSSITEHKIDCPSWKHKNWQYLMNGKLHSNRKKFAKPAGARKSSDSYSVGDLVLISSNAEDPDSPFIKPRVAVIAGVSDAASAPVRKLGGDFPSHEYIVYYVGSHGGPKHSHLSPALFKRLVDVEKAPEVEPFILLYSKVLRNKTSKRVRSIVQRAIDEDMNVASPTIWSEISI